MRGVGKETTKCFTVTQLQCSQGAKSPFHMLSIIINLPSNEGNCNVSIFAWEQGSCWEKTALQGFMHVVEYS